MINRYSKKQIFIHWITFLCLLISFSSIYLSDTYAKVIGGLGNVYTLHKSIGIFIFILTLIRLLFLKIDGVPNILPPEQKLTHFAAKAVQGLLYLFLILMPLSGFLLTSRPINFFWLVTINPLDLSESIRETILKIHVILQYVALVLIGGHAFMALVHHYIFKDNVLKAMSFLK